MTRSVSLRQVLSLMDDAKNDLDAGAPPKIRPGRHVQRRDKQPRSELHLPRGPH